MAHLTIHDIWANSQVLDLGNGVDGADGDDNDNIAVSRWCYYGPPCRVGQLGYNDLIGIIRNAWTTGGVGANLGAKKINFWEKIL